MTTHLFSGYSRGDLTTDKSFFAGDSFTVPTGGPTQRFEVEDDDDYMSGDQVDAGSSDDASQSARVQRDAGTVSGPIYID